MRRQLDEIHAAGEPLAILWASEGGIYGRFGYGPSTRRVTYEVLRGAARRSAPTSRSRSAPGRLATPADALQDMRARLRARCGPLRAGMLDRDDRWWERLFRDPEHRRDGRGARRAVVQPGPDGEPAGYALYAVESSWGEHGPDGQGARARAGGGDAPRPRSGCGATCSRSTS